MDFLDVSEPYNSEPSGTAMLRVAGQAHFKLYFLQIVGRTDRSRYEWSEALRSKEQTVAQLEAHSLRGVGFACIFPHITKVFFFGSAEGYRETNLYVRAFGGDPLRPISLEYGECLEVACAGEMDIASKEFTLWQRCSTVEEYLGEFIAPSRCGFASQKSCRPFSTAASD